MAFLYIGDYQEIVSLVCLTSSQLVLELKYFVLCPGRFQEMSV